MVFSFLKVEMTQMGFCSDKTIANSRLRKSLGHLLYLKNLAKVCLTLYHRFISLYAKILNAQVEKSQLLYEVEQHSYRDLSLASISIIFRCRWQRQIIDPLA